MPIYQNTSVSTNKLIIGNVKLEFASVGTTAGGTWTNLGAGIVNNVNHNIEKYDVQAGNAPDPIEGISNETLAISGELIEYDGLYFASAMGGVITLSSSSTDSSIITAGGGTDITPKAFKITNRRIVSGTTRETVIMVYKATFGNGPQITLKSDNDADPVAVMPFEITAKLVATASVGNQLYSITKW
jgi:hypothetical protein